MITIVAINAKKAHDSTKTFFDNIHNAWDNKHNKQVDIIHIESIGKLKAPAKDVIIFHPRANHNNPKWFTKDMIEDFMNFDFPEKYYVFGDDGGKLLVDIEKHKPEYKTCRFIKVPVGEGFRVIHAHVVCAIVLWERFKRRDDIPAITDW